jgi:hypothetical protein
MAKRPKPEWAGQGDLLDVATTITPTVARIVRAQRRLQTNPRAGPTSSTPSFAESGCPVGALMVRPPHRQVGNLARGTGECCELTPRERLALPWLSRGNLRAY